MKHSASNSIEMMAAITKAAGGDAIALAPGNYGAVVIANRNFGPDLTIVAADPANPPVFSKINVSACSGLVFDGIKVVFTPWDGVKEWDAGFKATNCSNISVLNSVLEGLNVPDNAAWAVPANSTPGTVDAGVIQGWPTGRGAFFFMCSWVVFNDNKVTGFSHGVNTTQVDGLVFKGNEISGCRKVPINGEDVRNVLIFDSFFHDLNPWNFSARGDHGDFIHFWTRAGQSGASANIVIGDNFFAQGAGNAPLGIYLDDNGKGIGFQNVDILNNIMSNDNGQAIRIERVQDLAITNNTLVGKPDQYNALPKILLADAVAGTIQITKNLFMGFSLNGLPAAVVDIIKQGDNLEIAVADFDSIFVAPGSSDLDPKNWAVIPGSRAEGYGAPIVAGPPDNPAPLPDPAPDPVPIPVPDDPAPEDNEPAPSDDDEPPADDQEVDAPDDGDGDDDPEGDDEPGEDDDEPALSDEDEPADSDETGEDDNDAPDGHDMARPFRSMIMAVQATIERDAYLLMTKGEMIATVAALSGLVGDRAAIAEMCGMLREEAGLPN